MERLGHLVMGDRYQYTGWIIVEIPCYKMWLVLYRRLYKVTGNQVWGSV